MCRNKRLNSQILKGQALCWVWEKEFQYSGNSGISGENSAQSLLDDRSFAFRGSFARNHGLLAERLCKIVAF
jgi:hypothetical protein